MRNRTTDKSTPNVKYEKKCEFEIFVVFVYCFSRYNLTVYSKIILKSLEHVQTRWEKMKLTKTFSYHQKIQGPSFPLSVLSRCCAPVCAIVQTTYLVLSGNKAKIRPSPTQLKLNINTDANNMLEKNITSWLMLFSFGQNASF